MVTSTAVTVRIPAKRYTQPVIQEYARLERYFVHWYTDPATGKWELTSAKLRAMMNWPRATMGQLQKKNGPPMPRPSAYSVKIPVLGEM
jgi:hypothetical protein